MTPKIASNCYGHITLSYHVVFITMYEKPYSVQMKALDSKHSPATHCLALGKLIKLSVLQFPTQENGKVILSVLVSEH